MRWASGSAKGFDDGRAGEGNGGNLGVFGVVREICERAARLWGREAMEVQSSDCLGGLGNANDSEGENGRTDMGVGGPAPVGLKLLGL